MAKVMTAANPLSSSSADLQEPASSVKPALPPTASLKPTAVARLRSLEEESQLAAPENGVSGGSSPPVPEQPQLAAENASPGGSSPEKPTVSPDSTVKALTVIQSTPRTRNPSVIASRPAKEEDDPRRSASRRKHYNEDHNNPVWMAHRKHILIFSSAGKPIYSRYGDESGLSSVMGLLQAVISTVADQGDHLRHIVAGEHRFVFLLKGPFYLVGIACTGEPVGNISLQLSLLHAQIISTLTAGINKVFATRSNFDCRHLLSGTERLMDSLISSLNYIPSAFLDSIHCLRMDYELRGLIGALLQSNSHDDLIFSILMSSHRLVSMVRPSRYTLTPSDLLLLSNFVESSPSFRGGNESMAPICLPQFNDKGFMWCYVHFLAPKVALLLLSTKQESFMVLSELKKYAVPSTLLTWYRNIVKGLASAKLLDLLLPFVQSPPYSVREANIPGLLHFLYKLKTVGQWTAPAFEGPYADPKQQKRLLRCYQRLRTRSHSMVPAHKVYFSSSDQETILCWLTQGFELFAVFSPIEAKHVCIKAANSLLGWMQEKEYSLFVLNSPVF